ncbi:hypothetical protein B0H10DRAFT_2213771 [Mycena sp. CBHHK59/15]|nr:hypothetical protein B0H10DRAFT_2213771 [Mycena sp. CBHHK59/15]
MSQPIPSETVRQTLTRALHFAQIAVQLDAADKDTNAIVEAYHHCVSLMDNAIRRETDAAEVERLQAIRASYRDRIQVLLLCRSVPIAQQSTETLIGTAESEKFKPWKGG